MTIVKVPELTAMLSVWLAVSCVEVESFTVTVNVDVPLEVGVPLMDPEELSVNPAGNPPEVTCQVYGAVPPEADNAAE